MTPTNSAQPSAIRGLIVILTLLMSIIFFAVSYMNFSSAYTEAQYNNGKMFIAGDFQRLIDSQQSQTMSCSDNVMNKRHFIELGLDLQTVWGEDWSMSAANGQVVLTYPLNESGDSKTIAERFIDELAIANQGNRASESVRSVKLDGTDLIVSYRCG